MNDGLDTVVHASTSTLQAEVSDREKELEDEVLSLREKLDSSNTKRIELEDQLIDIRAQLVAKQQSEKDIQQQLKLLSEFAVNSGSSHQKTVDLKRMYDQILYKDNRIVELNNTIMEKERAIMDLQEMCREQGQVAQAKSMAVQIVNRRLREFDSRKFADASTETDGSYNKKIFSKREISPGRAIANLKTPNGNGSPPPDPSEDMSSYTTETQQDEVDFEREWSGGPTTSKLSRKNRKRVTFDLHGRPTSVSGLEKVKLDAQADLENENLSQAVVDLSTENDQLRRIIAEMEKTNVVELGEEKIAELEVEAEQARKEGKNQALRARAAAQARIKDLESKLLELKFDSAKEVCPFFNHLIVLFWIESLKATVEVLKSSREWSIMENARLLAQIADGKSKMEDLRGELDSILGSSAICRQQLETEELRNERLTSELRHSQRHSQQLLDEKEFFGNEITRLKGALAAQEELVSVLEGDLIVYEAHVGILRDSLGASKKEDRQVIRSKAFAAKLNAMEAEKQQITKRNNDERLRTKALHVKIRMLEQERDELAFRLQQYGGERHLADSLSATDDEMNDTKPTFHEQAALNVTMIESTISEPPALTSYDQYTRELSSCSNEALENITETAQLKSVDQSVDLIRKLNNLMLEVCTQLKNHGQDALFEQLEADLAMYQQSPDLEPIVVVQQVQRFVNEVIDSLMHGVSTLRIEKEAIRDQLDLMRIALSDAQALQINVENAQRQMEADQIRLDTDWEKVKAMLQQNNDGVEEKNDDDVNADVEHDDLDDQLKDAQDAKVRLEVRIDEMDKRVLEMMVEREQFEVKLSQLRTENAQVCAERSNALISLNEVRQQNTELDHLVETLRSEIDRLRVEAELSRNCLEDLRNSSWPARRNPSGNASAAAAQHSRNVAVPVPLVAPQVIVQNPSAQLNPPRTQLQSTATSAFAPVAATNRSVPDREEQQPGPSTSTVRPLTPDFEVLSTIAKTSQKVADYLRAQTERYNELHSSHPHLHKNSKIEIQSLHAESEEAEIKEVESETVAVLKSQLQQRGLEIQQLTDRCDELWRQIEELSLKLENSYSDFDKQYQQLTNESAGYTSEIVSLQNQLENLACEKANLEDQLSQQLLLHENQLLQLAESHSILTSSSADFSQQTHVSTTHISVQTVNPLTCEKGNDAESHSHATNDQELTSHNTSHQCEISYIVEEQRNVLKACLDESEEMEKYMTMAVDRMATLNSDLESCVDGIRVQVISLSNQVVEELNEQNTVVNLLAAGRTISAEQTNRLRTELDATRSENSRNLERINEVEAAYSTLENTFRELTKKYSSLQRSFELSTVKQKTETSNQTTETIIDGETVDRLNELNNTVTEMAASSTEAKERLQHCQERIQSLQSILSNQLFTTQSKLEELRSDEFVALKSSVVSSINEFKSYLLHSFGEVQSALEARHTSNESVRSEMESTERISRALVLCERICNDIAEDSRTANANAESSVCLETMLQSIHEHWRARQRELAENARALQEQRHLSEILEGRLNEAEAQLNAIQAQQSCAASKKPAPSSPPRTSPANQTPSEAKTNLHLAILAARLSTKQADNDALFRCNSELAHANVHLHAQVEHLQDCVQRVSNELDAVSNSISSNSRHSSIGSLPADSRVDEVSIESVMSSARPNGNACVQISRTHAQASATVCLTPIEIAQEIPEEKTFASDLVQESQELNEWGWDADEENKAENDEAVGKVAANLNASIAENTTTAEDSWGWGDDEENERAETGEEAEAWAWGEEAETTAETLDTANTENDSETNWEEW